MRGRAERIVVCALLVVSAWGFTGCYKDIRDYCEGMVDCEGGNDDDIDACVDYYKGVRNAAKKYDCKDEFDSLAECLASESNCESDYGDEYYTDGDECDGDYMDLYECADCDDDSGCWLI